jgi:hypothetical protein
MTRQAESERYLNAVSVVHGGGEANIRLADGIVSGKVGDNGVAFDVSELRRRGKNGSQASRSATATEDIFSACDKSRPDSPTRKRILDHKGQQRRQGRVEVPGLRGWQSSGIFNHAGPVRTP